MERTISSTCVFHTVKAKTLAAVGAIVAAVALPQVFHLLGLVSNMGTALGETFLPMHLAIFLVGLLAGPVVGLAAGALSPIVSFALTGMPTIFMLPFMVIELSLYGLIAGYLADKKMPTIVKLLLSQVGGRAVRALAIVGGYYLLSSPVKPAIVWSSIVAGLPGLVLQWTLIPLLVFYIDRKVNHASV